MEEAIVTHPVPTDIEWPPTEDELPYSDGMPMESHQHVLQFDLLRLPLLFHWKDRSDVFVGGNMFVYFSLEQVKNQDFRGPDIFIVLGTTRRARKSWVVWQEGKGPDVVIELLSDSTAEKDKGEKKLVYQNQLRVPEYFWYHPITTELAGFALRDGIYEPIEPDAQGRLLSRQLGLMLTKWEGEYQGVQACWLRWATLEGKLLPTSEEAAEQERQKAEEARQKAEAAIREAEELKVLLARYRERFGELPE
ncbi:MAG TPA: Uma2 family endonuclease [Candidatus Limnocylindrales bacterium]|nr:Uma2 family endonuclease [Candidatus Limnocylindrales bacterium]